MWTILIVLIDLFTVGVENNSLKVTHDPNNRLLQFKSLQECNDYTQKFLIPLLKFSYEHFDKKHGGRIVVCVQEGITL